VGIKLLLVEGDIAAIEGSDVIGLDNIGVDVGGVVVALYFMADATNILQSLSK